MDETLVKDFPPLIARPKRQFLISIMADKLKENDYRYAKIDRLVRLQDFGIDDTFFGGNVHTIAKLKNQNYYLLVSSHHETIGICMRIDELNKLSRRELVEWAELHKVEVNHNDSKDDIVNKLKAL